MNQARTGRLIAEQRKSLGLTQARLAERLHVSGQAVSKWETGRSVPDPSIMVELCDILGITVNELLNGERIDMDDYRKVAEETLVKMRMLEEEKNRQLLALEWIVGIEAVASFLAMTFAAAYGDAMPKWLRVAMIVIGSVLFAIGIGWSMRIEQTAGYYECPSCGHRYVPSIKAMYLSPHIGRSRKMRCPECGKRGYHKKVLLADDKDQPTSPSGGTGRED